MLERFLDLVLDESKWFTAAMVASLASVLGWLRKAGERGWGRLVILGALNRSYGCMIGVMGLGHCLAVSVAGLRGTLEGSPWLLLPLGLALAIPAWMLHSGAARLAAGEARWSRRSLALNSWLALSLVALGPHNLPLAAPACLNVAYQLHTRRAVGLTILSVAITADLALLVGSLVFLASGQTFEQFSGM
jgi:hypothetical protein